MEKKNLIGKKVRGFEFDTTKEGLHFDPEMLGYEGAIGTIKEYCPLDNEVTVQFEDGEKWNYPLDQIEQHLIEDTPSQYEVGMTVYDYTYGGKGVIEFISESSPNFPLSVQFEFHNKLYTSDGKPHVFSLHPSLSLTPYDPINGGATFPTFKPKLPEIEKGTLVYVRLSKKSEWLMRFFIHFNEDGLAVCFECQNKSGNGAPWPEYSLTNPLIDEKER